MAAASQIFAWEGTDKSGRKAKGEITSANVNVAKAELRKQGINAKTVKKKSAGLAFLNAGKKITPQDIALFTRQLATMMKAGVPLVQSFEIVAGGVDNDSLKDLILKIRDDISAGNTFASAISSHPDHFDALFCNLVDAGEQSGALETMLDRLATYKEKTEALKAKIKSAMNYPIAVLVVAGVVSGILLIKVVPQFEEIFAGFGADLPEFTQLVVNMSEFMQEWWFIGVAFIAVVIFAYKQAYKSSKAVRDGQDRHLHEPCRLHSLRACRSWTLWSQCLVPRVMWFILTQFNASRMTCPAEFSSTIP
jgi:type IV pilus assembly protein PilC